MDTLTPDTLATFLLYAHDAGNWGNLPWVSQGNITCTKAMRGNLTDLIKKGLIDIHDYDKGESYIQFTAEGKALAAKHGIDLSNE